MVDRRTGKRKEGKIERKVIFRYRTTTPKASERSLLAVFQASGSPLHMVVPQVPRVGPGDSDRKSVGSVCFGLDFGRRSKVPLVAVREIFFFFFFSAMISFGKVEYRKYITLSGGFPIRSIRVNGEQIAGSHVRVCRSDRVWAPLGSESAVWAAKPPKSHGLGLFPRVPQIETGGIQRTATLTTEHTKSSPFDSSYQVIETTRCAVGRSWSLRCCLDMSLGDVPAVSKERKMRISGRP